MLFDTHAHLEDEQLFPILEQVLEDASSAGLVGITAIGTTAVTSQKCSQLAQDYRRAVQTWLQLEKPV